MKKLALIALPLLLAACNGTGSQSGVQPYSIQMSALGYEVDDEGKITVASVTGQVVSSAGAGDVNRITYKATLLDQNGSPVTGDNNEVIAPQNGVLISGVKGGYYCYTPEGEPVSSGAATSCWMGAANAKPVMAGSNLWPQNAFSRAIVPGEWAVAHLSTADGGTAGWSADFIFTAEQSNGNTVTWKQNYQFLAPVDAGS